MKQKDSHTTQHQGSTKAGVCSSSDRQDKGRSLPLRSVSTPRRLVSDLAEAPHEAGGTSAKAASWVRRCLLFECAFWRRIEERARVEQVPVAPLLRDLAREALELREAGPGGVGRTKADRLMEAAEGLREELRDQAALLGAIGRAVLGVEQLLVHWATREGSLGVSEEELFAELQVLGTDSWKQVLEELRTPPEPPTAG